MVRMRGAVRRLLVFAFVAVIASSDVVEAGLFDGLLKGMMDKVEEVVEEVQEVFEETTKQFSVLSGIFGDGVTRGDLSLPEIVNGAFSRSNGVLIAGSSSPNMDWKLGDGSSAIAALSTGGGVAITKGNGTVTITTSKQKDKKKDKEEKECKKGKKGKKCREEKKEREAKEKEESKGIDVTGANINEAFFELISQWDEFVTSSIWDVQDGEADDLDASPSGEDDGGSGNEGSLETSSRVINGVFFGNQVPSGASFNVKFFFNNEENFYCSGSLIGYPYVLTAAHCGVVEGDQVRVGGRLLRSGYQAVVGEVFNHPKFEPGSLVHDLAIVRLNNLEDKEVLMESGVMAARINKDKKFPPRGFVGVLSGHGSAETNGQGVTDELHTTRHTVLKMERCQDEITQGQLDEHESYLCAGDGERSTTCVGDSGAGLWRYKVHKMKNGKERKFYEVFGVVSFGEVTDDALCPRGPPTVFQRTSENYKWISDLVGKENMP